MTTPRVCDRAALEGSWLLPVARSLYDVLHEARPYVARRAAEEGVTSDDRHGADAARVLERVDATLADAGELL